MPQELMPQQHLMHQLQLLKLQQRNKTVTLKAGLALSHVLLFFVFLFNV